MSFHPIKAVVNGVGDFIDDCGELVTTFREDPDLFMEAAEHSLTGHVGYIEYAIVNCPESDQLVSELKNIGTTGIKNCKDDFHDAINYLTSIKGYEYITAEYGELNLPVFDEAFSNMGDYCVSISDQLAKAVQAMRDYQDAGKLETFALSLAMFSTKCAEGIGRFGEMLIDGGGLLIGGACNIFGADEAAKGIKDFVGYDLVGNCDWLNEAYDNYEEFGSISRDCATSQIGVAFGEMAGFGGASKMFKLAGEGLGKIAVSGDASVAARGAAGLAHAVSYAGQSEVLNVGLTAGLSTFGGKGSEMAAEGKGYGEIFTEAGGEAVVSGLAAAGFAKVTQMAAEHDIAKGRMVDKAQAKYDKYEGKLAKQNAIVEEMQNDPKVNASSREFTRAVNKQMNLEAKFNASSAELDAAKVQQKNVQDIIDKRRAVRTETFEKIKNLGSDMKELGSDLKTTTKNGIGKTLPESEFTPEEMASKRQELATRQQRVSELPEEIENLKTQKAQIQEQMRSGAINPDDGAQQMEKINQQISSKQQYLEKNQPRIEQLEGEISKYEKTSTYAKERMETLKTESETIEKRLSGIEEYGDAQIEKLNAEKTRLQEEVRKATVGEGDPSKRLTQAEMDEIVAKNDRIAEINEQINDIEVKKTMYSTELSDMNREMGKLEKVTAPVKSSLPESEFTPEEMAAKRQELATRQQRVSELPEEIEDLKTQKAKIQEQMRSGAINPDDGAQQMEKINQQISSKQQYLEKNQPRIEQLEGEISKYEKTSTYAKERMETLKTESETIEKRLSGIEEYGDAQIEKLNAEKTRLQEEVRKATVGEGDPSKRLTQAEMDEIVAKNDRIAEINEQINDIELKRTMYSTELSDMKTEMGKHESNLERSGRGLKDNLRAVGSDFKTIGSDLADIGSEVRTGVSEINELKANETSGLYTGYTEKGYPTKPQLATDIVFGGGKYAVDNYQNTFDNNAKPTISIKDPIIKNVTENNAMRKTNVPGIENSGLDWPKLDNNTDQIPSNDQIPQDNPDSTDNPNNYNPNNYDPGNYNPGNYNPGNYNPGTTNPGTTDPGTTDPGTTDPGTTDPGTTDPGTTDPGTTEPGTNDPGTTDPGTTDPGTTDPGTTNPGYNPGGQDVYNPANDDYTGSYHTGGGYSSDGYTPSTGGNNVTPTSKKPTNSIDDIIKGNKYTKVPTSTTPISPKTQSESGLGGVLPIAAGLSAAAAAGIGAKAYLDRKKNNDNGEYDEEDDDFGAEEWSGDESTLEVDYDDSSDTKTEQYLDDDDELGYEEVETTEKYGARNNEELADLQ